MQGSAPRGRSRAQTSGMRMYKTNDSHSHVRPHPAYLQLSNQSGVEAGTSHLITEEVRARLEKIAPGLPRKTTSRCWWHHKTFDTPPIFLVMSWDPVVLFPAPFCGWSCKLAFAHYNRHDSRFKTANVYRLAQMLGVPTDFKMADHWSDQTCYGGAIVPELYDKKLTVCNLESIQLMPPFVTFPLATKDTWKEVETEDMGDLKNRVVLKPPDWFGIKEKRQGDTKEAWSLHGLKPPSVEETVERLARKKPDVPQNSRYAAWLKRVMNDPRQPDAARRLAERCLTEKRPETIPPKNRNRKPRVIGMIDAAIPKVAKTPRAVCTIAEALSGAIEPNPDAPEEDGSVPEGPVPNMQPGSPVPPPPAAGDVVSTPPKSKTRRRARLTGEQK